MITITYHLNPIAPLLQGCNEKLRNKYFLLLQKHVLNEETTLMISHDWVREWVSIFFPPMNCWDCLTQQYISNPIKTTIFSQSRACCCSTKCTVTHLQMTTKLYVPRLLRPVYIPSAKLSYPCNLESGSGITRESRTLKLRGIIE